MDAPDIKTLAAVDLGSNSFHMVVARVLDGQPQKLDRIKERVRLAGGLNQDGYLTDEAMERAFETLRLFGQRLRGLPSRNVRAVGTNTLRKAKNADEFLVQAEFLLGHPIEIVSRREEARLVYLGVARDQILERGRRLVVDIGGGSTEVIIGSGTQPLVRDSLYMGCVSYSNRFFPDGVVTDDRMKAAQTAAELELRPIKRQYRKMGWGLANGSSGTVNAIERIMLANGFSDEGITKASLRRLKKRLLAGPKMSRMALPGLTQDRAPVLPGGLAILRGVFNALRIERMFASGGALREGVLYELMGRLRDEDVRDVTVASMADRYQIDRPHALAVEQTALAALASVAATWQLDVDDAGRLLRYSALLHEIGLSVSYSGYHRHGAYLVQNSDMPGFARGEQALLAALVLGHRRKLKPERLRAVGITQKQLRRALRLTLLLRLAVCLNRSRDEVPVPSFTLRAKKMRVKLALPASYLEAHPLTKLDLEAEAAQLQSAGFELTIVADETPRQ